MQKLCLCGFSGALGDSNMLGILSKRSSIRVGGCPGGSWRLRGPRWRWKSFHFSVLGKDLRRWKMDYSNFLLCQQQAASWMSPYTYHLLTLKCFWRSYWCLARLCLQVQAVLGELLPFGLLLACEHRQAVQSAREQKSATLGAWSDWVWFFQNTSGNINFTWGPLPTGLYGEQVPAPCFSS